MAINITPVTIEDARQIYEWQTEPGIRQYFREPAPPEWKEHLEWINNNLGNQNKLLYLVKQDENSIGFLHLTRLEKASFEVSILISPDYQGKGVAREALIHIRKMFPFSTFHAQIHNDNIASKKLFSSLGYQMVEYEKYVLDTKIKSKSCTIYANAGTEVGLGHLRRCLELAQELYCSGWHVIFFTPTVEHFSIYDAYPPFDYMSLPAMEDDICNSAEGADILIIDHYDLNLTKTSRNKNRTWKLIIFDDNGKRKMPVDMVINGSPSAYTMDLSKLGAKKILAGSNYQIINSRLRQSLSHRNVKEPPVRCLVTVGASDGNGLLQKLIDLFEREICRSNIKLKIYFIVGPLVKVTPTTQNPLIEIYQSPENIHELMEHADIAISASGQTLMELLYCAVPTIAICISDNQLDNLIAIESEGCIISAGSINQNGWQKNIIDSFENLLANEKLRIKLSEKSKKLIDGKGVERIVAEITKLHESK